MEMRGLIMAGTLITEFSESDVRFIVETVDPRLLARFDTIKGDAAIVEGILDQEAGTLFQRLMVMKEEDVMTGVSPRLLFEVLLRRALTELQTQSYTLERTASQTIPVFDTRDVAQFLGTRTVLRYLADMLSSFTRTESFVLPIRVRKGVWRRIRFSDMDIDSLVRLCEAVDEEHRFTYYKRIADVCLFIPGMFPEHVNPDPPYPTARDARPQSFRRVSRSAGDYEEEGRRFYKLAAEHENASVLELEETLWQLHERFHLAKKPLNHISANFLQFKRERLFTSPSAD